MGTAERVAETMHDSFPSAAIYTTVARPHSLPRGLRAADIRTSALQRLPSIDRSCWPYLMLYPFAVEHFDLSQYDLIFTSVRATQRVCAAGPTRFMSAIVTHQCVG